MGLSYREITERNKEITKMYKGGTSAMKIATLFHITTGRVYQIIWKEKHDAQNIIPVSLKMAD